MAQELGLSLTTSRNHSMTQCALDELQNTLEIAENYLSQGQRTAPYVRFHIKALQEDIDLVASVASSSDELQCKSFELGIEGRRIKRRLELLLIELETSLLPAAAPQASDQTATANVAAPETKPKSRKLSATKIPPFDGDATKFPVYRNSLVENVIDEPSLTVTSKWARLRNSLSGTPALLISEIPQMPEMLNVALKLLDDVYGGEKRVTTELHRKFHNLPPASSTTESIRATHAKLEGILQSLTHLNHPVNENQLIRSVYIEKFPSSVIYEVVKSKSTALQTIRDGIAQLLLARESQQK